MQTRVVRFSNAVTSPICPHCDDVITVHADGTLACSCQFVSADEPLPAVWSDSSAELHQLRDNTA